MPSNIEWTDKTWNPVRGCSRISEGCRNCYAERMAARFSGTDCTSDSEHLMGDLGTGPFAKFAAMTNAGPRWTGKVELIEHKLAEPLRWRKPRRIFVNSMSDLFHEALPDEAIDRVFAVMALCPQHTFQVLTKRARRMCDYLSSDATVGRVLSLLAELVAEVGDVKIQHNDDLFTGLKIPNVHLGVSVEDQQTADERIPWLLQTPAAKRFVSYEPALGPVDFTAHLPQIGIGGVEMETWPDQIIVGGESGPGARPFDIQWARETITQCRAAGVKCFVKQLGSFPSGNVDIAEGWPPTRVDISSGRICLHDRKGSDPSEWPADLWVREEI